MYEGLPITSNKIPAAERNGIPHHLLGCVKLGEEPWTVKRFREKANDLCHDIRSRRRLPILVGGTHYYVQAMLFDDFLVDQTEHHPTSVQGKTWPVLEASTEEMLEELRKVDPVIALRWHPKDRRKIRRSLEIWLQSGIRASEVYEQQRQRRSDAEIRKEDLNAAGISEPNDFLVLWTYASADALNPRLDQRVDKMIANGLYEEVKEMHNFAVSQDQAGHQIDQSYGIWIAIGYKECLQYVLDSSPSSALEAETVERTKISTRQYAKRQVRWIRLKLLPALHDSRSDRNTFLLDAADLSKWSLNVETVALNIVGSFLKGEDLPQPSSLSSAAQQMLVTKNKPNRVAKHCQACDRTLMSDEEWALHLKSKGHRSATMPKPDWNAKYPYTNEMIREAH